MPRQPVHGILLLDKPLGMSSHTALARAKRAFNAQKGGHTGTLDPLATGLLPLCLGEGTKFASDLLDADKYYLASLRLGQTTSTGDAEGGILQSRPVAVDRAEIEAVLVRFRGPILQIPPMYSALKREGRPLYEYARAGVTLERAPRAVTIHALQLRSFVGDVLILEVACSKGTYVRTLAEDIGEALGCGAHLSALRRTGVGSLHIEQAITLAALEALDGPSRSRLLLPVDFLVQSLPRITLSPGEAARFQQGQSIQSEPVAHTLRVSIYADKPEGPSFLGVGERHVEGRLVPIRLLAAGLLPAI